MKSKLRLKSLRLHQFRLYKEKTFTFTSGVNLFFGDNAHGKTTILEAIYLLMTGRSFRTSQLTDVITSGKRVCCIEGEFEKHGISQHLKVVIRGKQRQIFHNNTLTQASSHLWGLLQGVVMTPDDLSLIKGGPAERRRFLDMQIVQGDPLYVHHLMRYHRALRQRNALLKQNNVSGILPWEEELAKSGAYLIYRRSNVIQTLSVASEAHYLALTGTSNVLSLSYSRKEPLSLESLSLELIEKYERHRQKEFELGFTFSGPHRDDFTVKLDHQEVKVFASQGQQRATISALKIAEWESLKDENEEIPLMLVDDIGVSLDAVRRDYLLQYLQKFGQVFLTSTEELFLKNCQSQKIDFPS